MFGILMGAGQLVHDIASFRRMVKLRAIIQRIAQLANLGKIVSDGSGGVAKIFQKRTT